MNRSRPGFYKDRDNDGLETKVIQIKRVSNKNKGGNQIGFTALVAVGDGKGSVGMSLARAKDVGSAIRKAERRAKKRLVKVVFRGEDDKTIPKTVKVKYKASQILLKPAPRGTGLITGGPIRIISQLAGLDNLVAKIFGSRNKTTVVYAVEKALLQLSGDSK